MNKLIISGNLVRDVDLSFTPGNGTAVLRNTVAAKRRFKDQHTGKYESDYIPFVSFGKTAELIANHFQKGQAIALEASMRSGSYEKDGKKVYTLEAVVESVEFMGSKKETNNSNNTGFGSSMSFEEDMTPVDDGDIPF